MKRVIFSLGILISLVACNRSINIDIEGRLVSNGASMIYMVVQNNTVDTLASTPLLADNTFHLKCSVKQPTTAFLCDDNGNALTMFLTEDHPLKMLPTQGGGYSVEGGPINDKYNLTLRQISSLAEQIMHIDQHSETAEEEYESLVAKYHNAIATTITYNLDNIIGVELFLHHESLTMSAEDMRVRFAQFSPKMQALPPMRQFQKYIDIVERCQIGKPYIDATLQTITGQQMALSEICGKGKWVLLDFWATWSEPCLRTIPTLKEAYERYALTDLEICSISLDPDIERLRAFVAKNQMLWINAFNPTKEGERTVAEEYGIHSIPTNFLISPSGEIVARDLQGDNLLHELQHRLEGADFCTYPQLHNNQSITPEEQK